MILETCNARCANIKIRDGWLWWVISLFWTLSEPILNPFFTLDHLDMVPNCHNNLSVIFTCFCIQYWIWYWQKHLCDSSVLSIHSIYSINKTHRWVIFVTLLYPKEDLIILLVILSLAGNRQNLIMAEGGLTVF